MKRVISLLVLALLQSVSMMAQRLTIEQFAPANEFTASQYPRQDANGKDCALLKVQVVDAITGVEGGVVGAIADHGSEKWVYIEDGQREFKIIFANHLPIQISTRAYPDIGAAGLKSGSTYVLTLADTSGGTAVVDEGKQFLVMNVQPKNATVLVNGEMQPVDADGVVTAFLPYGTYSYRVMAVGYKDESGTVTVGREKSNLNISLVSTRASLSVTCATPNADIYINGSRKGNGSWSGQLAAGTYSIEAKRTGYRSSTTSVTLAENDSRSVNIPALTQINGAIKVNYTPANAEVWLDGTRLGTSPDIFRNIGVGSHSLQIKKDGYQDKTISVNVSEGQTADVFGSLEKESNAEELYNKGKNYYNAKDYSQAVSYYRKAAEQGYAEAQCYLGFCYDNGYGVTQDHSQAASWYRKAAEQGNATAQYNLGWCYECGNGVTQDYSQAASWYRKAAEQGYAAAQCNLGVCYYNGHGLPQDYSQAVSWFGKAAEQGFAQAQHNLGYCYAKGFGLKQDYSQAVSWYRKAAEQGNAVAQYNLGLCYKYGNGVTQSYSQAAYWYRKAADQGHTNAKTQLKKLQDEGKI